MYKINKSSNSIQQLKRMSFSSLGFRERDHLQEWIAKQPDVLGEDLLIIQKEFSGFEDTQERLDLLALDKNGALVIIENKLDDSGKDVTWQAMKYASYCSGLTKGNITKIFQDYLDTNEQGANAQERLVDFMDGVDYEEMQLNKGISQRIILIAAKFRKEVTSTVLWLMNYKVRMQCFRATPYAMGEELFLNVEQIIPTQDAEEYMIGMADKAQDETDSHTELKNRHIVRKQFWSQLLSKMNASPSSLFSNISPMTSHYIGAGSGISRVRFVFVVSKSYGRAELYIDRAPEENKFIFDSLFGLKSQIEKNFGGQLTWERLDGKRASRIKASFDGNVFDDEQWPTMIETMTDSMVRLESALKPHLVDFNEKLKAR
jgi:hypothetical protein